MPRVALFDIDNTLLYTGGAGSFAMNAAFNELYGVPDGFARVEFSGPGFPQLLAALRDAGVRLGLATGNFSEAARIKLEYYGIAEYFEGGGFGEVSLDRSDVVAAAIRNVANGARPSDVLVVGDTPHDITSATANGAIGVGAATGKFTVEELRDSGAAMVYEDFADWEAVGSWRRDNAVPAPPHPPKKKRFRGTPPDPRYGPAAPSLALRLLVQRGVAVNGCETDKRNRP